MSFEVRAAGDAELRTVWEWEYGPVVAATDAWLAQMAGWGHLGIWRGAELVGVVSWEPWPQGQVCMAVSTKRRSLPRPVLRTILIQLGDSLFEAGVQAVCCIVPPGARAVRRLALSCRMMPGPTVRGHQLFLLPQSQRFTE